VNPRPGTYTFDELLNALNFCNSTFDEGLPGPEYYTKTQLAHLVMEAVDLVGAWQCFSCDVDAFDLGEDYYVHDELWRTYGVEGMLCIGCLETRMGRKLTPDDFKPGQDKRDDWRPMSDRMRDRLGLPAE
jgi:hypothetical protein